ncbi:FAD-binding protein [Alteromonas sp. AMM-1]|uniref:FAD-binding protein n=1 Tax=Alteromonas sp. AMM-1 TaxID=3394233 RepID=UPI0039A6C6D6
MDIYQTLRNHFDSHPHAVIISTEHAIKAYSGTTFSDHAALAAAIKISHREIIPSLLALANSHNFVVHPVSSNKNWGYGSITQDSANRPIVLLDLSGMCQITPTSKSLGLITIEPGVTQQMLYDYLQEQDWQHMVPVTGAGPSCSVLSNALERGYGITPHTDHFYACTALKAFIPHPDLCQQEYASAVSALDKSEDDFIDKTFKWGLGPYLDGLFTQSNLGIVSEMTIRLAKKPNAFSAFYIQVFDAEKFKESVEFIRTLLESQAGMVGSINLMDKRRLVSMTCKNPNIDQSPIMPLTDEQVNSLAAAKRLPEWMIVGSIYGDQPVVNYVKKYVKRHARKLGRILFSDSLLLKMAHRFASMPLDFIPMFKDVKAQLTSLQEGVEIMLGKPNQVALPLPYWRNPSKQPDKALPLHPADDQCGLLWYAPLIAMDPSTLSHFVDFVRNTMLRFELDPFITFTNLKHDCIDSTVPLVFDKQDPAQTEKAHACLRALIDEGCKQGFVPYRLPVTEQARLDKGTPFWQSIKVIKQAMDPNNILSPGKYDA